MFKKTISVLLAVLMLASLFAVAATAADYEDGTLGSLTWQLNKTTGELRIAGTGEMPNYNHRSLKSPFDSNPNIKKVVVGEGVTSVGGAMFYGCTGLTKAVLPSTVDTVQISAFHDCASLADVNMENVIQIRNFAFYNTGFTEVNISAKTTFIGLTVFADCEKLTRFTAAQDNAKYGSDADGVLYEKEYGAYTKLLQYPAGRKQVAYGIADTVKTVCYGAFVGANALTDVLIPYSVEVVDNYAFSECRSLTRIGFGENITTVGQGAFTMCNSLKSVYSEAGAPAAQATVGVDNEELTGAAVYTNCEFGVCGDEMVYYYDPSAKRCTVEGRGDMDEYDYDMNPSEFGYLAGMTSASIGRDVAGVSDYAFWGCDTLLLLIVESGNKNYEAVDGVLFSADGTRLCAYPSAVMDETYTVPDGVAEIAPGAFGEKCESLKKVILPKSLKTVGYSAFENCGNLKNVTYRGGSLSWGAITIEDANDPLKNAERKYTADTLNITVPEPKEGETPVTSLTTLPSAEKFSPYNNYALRWSPTDATFKKGTAYTVTVTAELKNNYVLPDDTADVTATINGHPVTVSAEWISLGGSSNKTWYLKASYTFPAVGAEPEVRLGDVDGNGEINSADARLCLRRAVALETYEKGSKEFIACDVHKDNQVTAADARLILRAAVGLEDPSTW